MNFQKQKATKKCFFKDPAKRCDINHLIAIFENLHVTNQNDPEAQCILGSLLKFLRIKDQRKIYKFQNLHH